MIDRPIPPEAPMGNPLRSLILVVVLATTGCATMEPPRPWEKGDLAKPAMQIDPDRLETKIQQHIYASKEAATGGYGVGGGGCGCN
jgi:Domain of unknown function (DUF4266)